MISVLLGKTRWHLNQWMLRRLWFLDVTRGWLTVIDAFGAPGDTLLAATVCRVIKKSFPRLKINLLTQWPDLVRHDPCLDAINAPESYFTLRFWYIETVGRKEQSNNVLLETLVKVGILNYEYQSRVYLTPHERQEAHRKVELLKCGRPLVAFSTLSKEHVKNWPRQSWAGLLHSSGRSFTFVHLGDDREPVFDQVPRFAGKLTMRESMALLSACDIYVGPDSFLMHAANGLDIPSAIIFGGARPSACLGYADNINLYVPMPCGPCWLHDSRGDVCSYDTACMKAVKVDEVEGCVRDLIERSGKALLSSAS